MRLLHVSTAAGHVQEEAESAPAAATGGALSPAMLRRARSEMRQFCAQSAGVQAEMAALQLAPMSDKLRCSQVNPALTHALFAAAETPLGRSGSASAQSWQPTTMTSCCPRWSRTAPSECDGQLQIPRRVPAFHLGGSARPRQESHLLQQRRAQAEVLP